MEKYEAKQIINDSVANLQRRRSENITTADLEAEVINNACLIILERRRERDKKGLNLYDGLSPEKISIIEDLLPVSKAFTDAAIELYPNNYNDELAAIAHASVMMNIKYDGMWDFLREYFKKNHGINIDNIDSNIEAFFSSIHKRYENGNFVSESEVARNISIQFIDNKREAIVTIEPTLSPKKSRLISKTENQSKYRGYDPDYLFIINLDDFEEIESFTLEMPNRSLKIDYFE